MSRPLAAALSQRWLVLLVLLGLVVAGIQAWRQLPIDAFPDISPTQVKVIIKAPGMTPQEVESQISRPLEIAFLGIPKQRLLRTTVKYAISDITLDFEDGTDIYWARQQVANRLNDVRPSLPADIQGGVAPMSTPLSDVFMFSLESPQRSLMDRRLLLERVIRPALRVLPGVADVNVLGGDARVYNISPKPQALLAAGLSWPQLAEQIQQQNGNTGAGRLDLGAEAMTVRVQNRLTSLDALRALPIAGNDQQWYRLADLATVSLDRLERYGAVTRNGDGETVQGLVMALRGTNTGELIARVQARLASLQSSLPDDVKVNVFYNRQQLIDTAIGTVTEALGLAVALVVLVLVLFLGNIRAALLVAINLPLAALATFLLMRQTGMTANLMSLGGLVIAIGMLVDSAVVVVENTLVRLGEEKPLPRLHLLYQAVKEVAVPVTAGTLIIVTVFLPLLTLDGLEGKLFMPVALTVVFALVSSLLLSLFALPVLASWLLRGGHSSQPKWVDKLQQGYRRLLEAALKRQKAVLAALLVILVLSAALFTQLGKTFMPTMDEGDIIVQFEKVPTISLAASVALDNAAEKALMAQVPEIVQIVARTGSDEIGMDPMGLNETDVFMQLAPRDKWRFATKAELENAIREALKPFKGMNISFTQPIDMRVSEMLTGARGDVVLKIFGPDLATLASLARQAEQLIAQEPGAIDTQTAVTEGSRFLNIRPKETMAVQYGLNAAMLGRMMRRYFEGVEVGQAMEGEWAVPLLVRSREPLAPATLAQLPLVLSGGKTVTLGEVASISRDEGPVVISRENASRFAQVRTNVSGRDLVGFVDAAKVRLAQQLSLPTGYHLVWGGQFENQQRAAGRLLLVVPLALVLIFLLLLATFRSSTKALLVLANVPFALTGGVLGLYLGGEYMSVPASVGFIALMGVSVLNGVVMISHFEELHRQGIALTALVRDGAVRRLRPILMTASTGMLGLLPLLSVTGPGSELQRPLAMVVVGGLISATLVTLILMPMAYQWLMGKNNHVVQETDTDPAVR